MTRASRRRQLALLLHGLEVRVTNLEQRRRSDAPVRNVMNIAEAGVETGLDSVTTTKKTDFVFKYDVSGNDYNQSEWADAGT